MSGTHDVIVVGLGAMGSAALYHLAQSGRRVVGLDRFTPPHAFGSSHGQTRIIREAYFEHPLYVPLVQRAYELWFELEAQTGRKLLLTTGGLMIGARDGLVFGGAKRSAEAHRLPHEILSSTEIHRRFPALYPEPEMAAVWEPRAGILFPEECIAAHLELARRHGAMLHLDEQVLGWRPDGTGVAVQTTKGIYRAERLVLAAGAWMGQLLPELALPLKVERQVLFWFESPEGGDRFKSGQCPIHLWEYEQGKFFYGFPDLGEGVKVARHHQGNNTEPDSVRRDISADEVAAMRQILRRFLPGADGALRSATVCLYTNTPDGHFLIDMHPEFRQVIIASPCSGHGFKFASAVGEVLAGLVTERRARFDLSLFHLRGG